MKLTAIALLGWRYEKDPVLLGLAANLSSLSYLKRKPVKEMLIFVSRTAASATSPGLKQSVQHEQYFCHVHNLGGLIAAVFVDDEYPSRPAFAVAKHVIDKFDSQSRDKWREEQADCTVANEILEASLQEFQVGMTYANYMLFRSAWSGALDCFCLAESNVSHVSLGLQDDTNAMSGGAAFACD